MASTKTNTNGKATQRRIRITIADDHAIVRQGLRHLIEDEGDIEICADVESPDEALDAIKQFNPDVAVMDLTFEGVSGFGALRDIKTRHPNVHILVLSMHDEGYYAERCLRNGAAGYIMKQEAPDQIIKAIRKVARGQIYLSERMASRLLDTFLGRDADSMGSPVESLTDRELQVFELLGQGLGSRKVAERLHLSIKTIESHRANIMAKLKIADANELIKHAVRWVEDQKTA
ncbi:MAG: response regulator [Phycisphaera sp.]|nr:response regulator [Phycisphaera sp.]